MWFEKFIQAGFAASLFFNALFYVPQIVQLVKTKDAAGISLLMFGGFVVVQIFTIVHAYLVKDYILFMGFLFSLLTCGIATGLIIFYRVYPGGLKNRKTSSQ